MNNNDANRTVEIPKPTARLSTLHDDATSSRASFPDHLRFTLVETNLTIEMSTNHRIVIGRQTSSASLVNLDLTPFVEISDGVSRQHCIICEIYGKLMIQDLDSTNGTLLNDEALKPYQRYELHSGDQITLGRCAMMVEFIYKRHYANA